MARAGSGPTGSRERRQRWVAIVRGLAVPVVVILVWYILSWTVFVVPAPQGAVRTFGSDLAKASYRAQFGSTTIKILVAFGLSAVIGIVAGAALGLVKPLREALEPLVLIVNGVPKIVLYPILLIVFGLGSASQITMGVLFGTLPILVNLMAALVSMSVVYRKVARMLETSRPRTFFRVYVPAVAPMLMVALQLGFSLSVLGVVYGELIASNGGLGQQLIDAYSAGDYNAMAANILSIFVIAFLGAGLLRLAEGAVMRRQ